MEAGTPTAMLWKHTGLQIRLSQGQGSTMSWDRAAARCVRWRAVAAGAPDAMLWKHPGLQIGLSQGQGSNMG